LRDDNPAEMAGWVPLNDPSASTIVQYGRKWETHGTLNIRDHAFPERGGTFLRRDDMGKICGQGATCLHGHKARDAKANTR
jgi:hypothetical protein